MQPSAPASFPSESLLSDAPAATQEADEFQRYPFAQRIAATIRARRDAASLVLGLYGKWGSGKTSILNFIQRELQGSDVITMVFNPWLFSGEEQLLLGFFAEFGEKLAPLGAIGAQAASTALNEYSKKIAARARLLRQEGNEVNAQAFEASAALEGIQQQLRETLHASGKRILVLIDDIDRLDKHEVQALLRLVKLTADFPYTTYLLAFDDAIVARALSERYPGSGKAAGKRFLEKIIQVPLRLPTIQKEAMLKYFEKRLKQLFDLTETQLTDQELSRLSSTLAESVLHQPLTPRDVNRYANTLSVVMPLLQGEANIVDLMLIEALKIFFPASYKLVMANQRIFTGAASDSKSDELRKRYEPLLGKNANDLGSSRNLVLGLFPKLLDLYTEYNFRSHRIRYHTEDELYDAKSIASDYYFKRYFSYAVQEGEIPDKSFIDFSQAVGEDNEQAYHLALKLIERAGEGEFFRLLKRTQPSVTSATAPFYCALLVRLSDKFSIQPASEFFFLRLSSVPELFLGYVAHIVESQQITIIQEAVQHAAPSFAYRLVQDIHNIIDRGITEEYKEIGALLTPAYYKQIAETFITRVLQELAGKPLYQEYESRCWFLYSALKTARGPEELNDYILAILAKHPQELFPFLRYLSPHGYSGKGEYYGHLDESTYSEIAANFDIERLHQVAKALVGDAEPLPYHKERGPASDDQRLHEFIYLHHTAAAKPSADSAEETS